MASRAMLAGMVRWGRDLGAIVQTSLKRCVARLLAARVRHRVLDDRRLWRLERARDAGDELIWRDAWVVAAARALLLAGLDRDQVALVVTRILVYHVVLGLVGRIGRSARAVRVLGVRCVLEATPTVAVRGGAALGVVAQPARSLRASVAAFVDSGRADRLSVLLALGQPEVLLSYHSSGSVHDSD